VRETALRGLGRYRDSLAAGENALAVCDQAVTLDPGNANAHLAKGAALRAVGRHQDALAACDRASALSPGNSNAHVARAITLLDLGRYDEALAACDRAIRLNPLNLSAHGNRGVTLHAQGRHRDALAAYDEAAALAPLNAAVLEHKGIVLAATGDLDRALAEFDSARRMNPNGAGEGSAWAGAILWHRCEPVQARDHFKLVEGRVGRSAPFHMAELEAIALCGVGQPDRAEQHLRSVIHRRSPGDRLQTEPVYELLSDPPLPGIDRLRRATDG
jgi:tetratricopeptide (TPR) repeat protein